ncbi:hypothetical protein ACLB2K_073801 [Fragaria x ananassa]
MALLEFKAKITGDPLGVMASWNKSIHFCHWHGVICGRRHQRVTELDLHSMKLSGYISPHVGDLSFLRAIHLQNNSFRHELPPEMGRLHRLQDLQLNNNSLSGEIPSNLSSLLSTPQDCSWLKFPNWADSGGAWRFVRAKNSFAVHQQPYRNLSGKLPHSVLNVSSILHIALAANNIQGTLPSNLGIALPNLEALFIDDNQLDGSIPVSICNASNLNHLGMGGNKLHGQVPSLVNLHKLERLSLAFNSLGSGGRINDDLSFLCDLTNATSLYILQLQENNFGGILPQCTTNLSSSLDYFSVAANKRKLYSAPGCAVHPSISAVHFEKVKSPRQMDGGDGRVRGAPGCAEYALANKIHGSFPYGFGDLANLESLWLSENQFSGTIPADVGKLANLYGLYMNTNSFSGNIPASLGNMTRLTELYLEENRLEGSIPSSLADCQNLMITSLGVNNLSGIISPEVFGLSSSYIFLDLSQNHLTGSLPKEVGNLINLEYLDVSENMLFGEIPGTLGSCVKLEYLNMHGKFLRGPIPSSLASLRGIQELYLSRNNLSGTIPEFLEHFAFLHALNLSYNNLEGMAPTEGVFKNATGTSLKGNIKLCGGIPEFQLPPCKVKHPKRRGLSKTFKLILSLVCGILGISFVLVFLYLCCVRKERKKQTTPSSFGSVYKGVLDQDETTIAVKVLNLIHHGASKSFAAECEALKNIRHRNLLKVLSACSGFDYKGDDFKALVYEFMANGSLEEWLHPVQKIGVTNESPMRLMFSQRLNIAIDVSLALDYLRNHCETPIVHCDLKPSNVLLDEDMVGHVGDFGLVRFLPRTSGHQSSSIGVKGTIGYAPPGKRPTDNMFQGTLNLHNFVRKALPKQVRETVDPVLVPQDIEAERGAWDKIEASLISILEVGVACFAELPRERLAITDAMAEMCRIRDKLHGKL